VNRTDETKLKASLTAAIERWLGEPIEGGAGGLDAQLPWLGGDIAEIMAVAAFSVLRGIADAQEYMEREGMLKEDE
jgi:hypothetical protein